MVFSYGTQESLAVVAPGSCAMVVLVVLGIIGLRNAMLLKLFVGCAFLDPSGAKVGVSRFRFDPNGLGCESKCLHDFLL
jgi:hypothetical protein